MVIFAIGGAVVAVGGVVVGAASHDDYSDYSRYDDYSDAVEKEKIKKEAERKINENKKRQSKERLLSIKQRSLMEFIEDDAQYRDFDVNSMGYSKLKKMQMSIENDIDIKKNSEIKEKTKSIQKEITALTDAINALEKIREDIIGGDRTVQVDGISIEEENK